MHARIVAAIAGALLAAAPIARAETVPPAQAVADRGAFLEHAPPPAQPAAVCIVDSGVDLNPDTASQVVYREAIDGGDPGDVSPDKHGTLMAMMAAAPINGWGMVGAAPGAVKIVSIRVEPPGQGTFAYGDYELGINRCVHLAAALNIKVISLSLAAGQQPTEDDLNVVQEAVDNARQYGLDVVGAAGNGGGSVESPASYPPVIAVGAASATESLCPFSSRGPGLDLIAPGCGLDAANPQTGRTDTETFQGTSEAAAITASVIAALRAYRTDLSVVEAEQLLEQSSSPYLDVTRLFQTAGLGVVVSEGTVEPSSTVPTASSPVGNSHAPGSKGRLGRSMRRQLPRPHVQLEVRHRRLFLRASNLPQGMALLAVLVRSANREFGRSRVVLLRRTSKRAAISLPLVRGTQRISVVYRDPGRKTADSPATTIPLAGVRGP